MSGFKSRPAKGTARKHNRPLANLDLTGITREWRKVKVQDLVEDDIVAGMGLVQAVTFMFDTNEVMLTVGYPNPKAEFVTADELLFAFVAKEN
jgi:hypothetical protein